MIGANTELLAVCPKYDLGLFLGMLRMLLLLHIQHNDTFIFTYIYKVCEMFLLCM